MCNMLSILGAIFALFLSFAQAKHQFLRVYPFSAADCNGPPILGNVDVPRDVCKIVPFGASAIKLMEIELGDWTREINRGATGCYFYAYTQHGCLERYLDIIVDPGDVMAMCIPSRDANDPIMAVSFTCIYGEPPRRRWELPAANKTAKALNMTDPNIAGAYRRGRALTEELSKPNNHKRTFTGSTGSDDGGNGLNKTSGPYNPYFPNRTRSISARSVTNHGPAFVDRERNVNLTTKANVSASDSPTESVSARSVKFHGPAFINGKPNFNSSHKLSKRESNVQPKFHTSGVVIINSTNEFNNSDPTSPVLPVSARAVNRHGPTFVNEEPQFNPSYEYKHSKSREQVQVGNRTNGLAYVSGAPIANRTNGQVFSVGTPTAADSDKDSEGSESSESDSDDSDWSDDESDGDGDEFETTGNSTSYGNSTSLGKRNPWWQGPRRGVWMLHPWTGGMLCYDCYSKHKNQLSRFECRWGYKQRADCGEKPLAPIYTKTVTIQPVVTVTPLPKRPSLRKRSWHMPVYLQNPWYPGITVCSIAEWEGKGKRWNQEIRIEQMHKKLKKCDKSPIAQNIAVFVRTATSTAPVKTVSIMDEGYNSVIPLPVAVFSTSTREGYWGNSVKTSLTTFEPLPLPTTPSGSSASTTSADTSVSTTTIAISVSTATFAVSAPSSTSAASVVTDVLSVGPLPTSQPMASYVEPMAFYSTIVVSRDNNNMGTPDAPVPTAAPEIPTIDLSPYAGVFTTVVVAHSGAAAEPEPEPTPQPPQLQKRFVDPNAGGFSTVIIHRVKNTP